MSKDVKCENDGKGFNISKEDILKSIYAARESDKKTNKKKEVDKINILRPSNNVLISNSVLKLFGLGS